MKIINKKFSDRAFLNYLAELKVWRHIDKLVLHHTSSPVETWKGTASMLHYYNLYRSRGWKTGPHVFIAPDGIWLFTPISKQGTHAGPEGNAGSIGIEIVGRYFNALPDNPEILRLSAVAISSLLDKFKLDYQDIIHHQHYHTDGNCSPLLTKYWAQNNIDEHKKYLTDLGFA